VTVWHEALRSLLAAASPAVLTTYRRDQTAMCSPVWYRWSGEAFEIVIARGDIKARHLEREKRCVFVVFETVPPFRGLELRTEAELIECDVRSTRRAIARRYLGPEAGETFTRSRDDHAILVRLRVDTPRVWDLARVLPA
jgi:hypothetical protein